MIELRFWRYIVKGMVNILLNVVCSTGFLKTMTKLSTEDLQIKARHHTVCLQNLEEQVKGLV